jgi:uncharacterized Fe-S center protein
MKRILLFAALIIAASCGVRPSAASVSAPQAGNAPAKVYFIPDVSSEALIQSYKALGRAATGKVAVKISTGESEKSNHLRPEFIAPLVQKVNGNIVECNPAYKGNRSPTAAHRKEIAKRGYDRIATVDIMDEEGEIKIPVADDRWIKYDIVGSHIQDYDFMINLAHFKGHAMGGFGGVMKNASIGVASTAGKCYIHSAGKTDDPKLAWTPDYLAAGKTQDDFLESMAAAAQAVHNYFNGKVIYINVMNNMSVDCDCDGHPAKPELLDMGIMASLDPVAVDQACLDKVFNYKGKPGDDNKPLIQRINRQHGTYITDYAEKIGFGSKKYTLVNIDE